MTSAALQEFKNNQPDKLTDSISQRLPEEQMDYIKANIQLDRYPLFKAFKKSFGSTIKKPQFNANVERAKEELTKVIKAPYKGLVYPMPQVEKATNVYWSYKQGTWEVKFRKNGKSKSVGRFTDHEKAKIAAEEYRQKLA